MAAQLFPGVHMPGLLGGNPGYPADMLHPHAAGMLPPSASEERPCGPACTTASDPARAWLTPPAPSQST